MQHSDMKKRRGGRQALCIASVASNLDNFNRNNVEILLSQGYEVTLAANFHTEEDTNSQEKIDSFAREMREKGVHIVQIDFSRKIGSAARQLRSVGQVRKLLKRQFCLIHCHAPICAAIVRWEARKYRRRRGTKVLYTAHGFHFFTGAPALNWALYYPVEKWMSRYTDVLLTVNREDYTRAKERFHASRTVCLPGVGVDAEKFFRRLEDRAERRRALGLADTDRMLLSVGELNENKNQELGILALARAVAGGSRGTENMHYFICGQGRLRTRLEALAEEKGLKDKVHFLGYRSDIEHILACADIFLSLSKREGLPVSLMEAMCSGLPGIVTRVRGNTDLIRDGMEGRVVGYGVGELAHVLEWAAVNEKRLGQMGENARKRIKRFDKKIVDEMMWKVYAGFEMSEESVLSPKTGAENG